jgi:hypothetical protein
MRIFCGPTSASVATKIDHSGHFRLSLKNEVLRASPLFMNETWVVWNVWSALPGLRFPNAEGDRSNHSKGSPKDLAVHKLNCRVYLTADQLGSPFFSPLARHSDVNVEQKSHYLLLPGFKHDGDRDQ